MQGGASAFPGTATLLVLSALESGEKSGFQIIRELELRGDRTFQLAEGTLYPLLHALERRGDVTSFEGEPSPGKPRRMYRLTRQGVRALGQKRYEWKLYLQKRGTVIGGEACDRSLP